MILEQFDPSKKAVIDPDMCYSRIDNFPETVVSVFSLTLFDALCSFFECRKITEYTNVDGSHPIFEVDYKNHRFAFIKACLGAPACVGLFEEVISSGAKRIILLGNCGVLDSNIEDCGIIIPTKAIRDEGCSYHYAPASDMIEINKKYKDEFKQILDEFHYPYVEGITWTTDVFYRETRNKVDARKKMGAICVEMECASMQAMCDFREIEFFQFFYAGDNLDHSAWQPRSLSNHVRLDDKQKIAILAFELACKMEER